jgi:hypothetical protein
LVPADSVLGNCMACSVKRATGTVIFGRMTVIDSDVNCSQNAIRNSGIDQNI